LTKVRPVGATLTDAETDRQTDGYNEGNKRISRYANEPKKKLRNN